MCIDILYMCLLLFPLLSKKDNAVRDADFDVKTTALVEELNDYDPRWEIVHIGPNRQYTAPTNYTKLKKTIPTIKILDNDIK